MWLAESPTALDQALSPNLERRDELAERALLQVRLLLLLLALLACTWAGACRARASLTARLHPLASLLPARCPSLAASVDPCTPAGGAHPAQSHSFHNHTLGALPFVRCSSPSASLPYFPRASLTLPCWPLLPQPHQTRLTLLQSPEPPSPCTHLPTLPAAAAMTTTASPFFSRSSLFSMTARSAKASSRLITSMSSKGSTLPATWITSSSSNVRTTCRRPRRANEGRLSARAPPAGDGRGQDRRQRSERGGKRASARTLRTTCKRSQRWARPRQAMTERMRRRPSERARSTCNRLQRRARPRRAVVEAAE